MKTYLYVTPFFPGPDTWRGAYCYDFVKALSSLGRFRVEVFKPGDGNDYEVDGIKVHTFKTLEMPSNIFPFLTSSYNQRSLLYAVRESGIGFDDIVVCHGNDVEHSIYPIAVKQRNRNCKTLLHHHSLGSFGFSAGRLRNNRLYRLMQSPILKAHHRMIDCHIFISEACRRHFVSDSGFRPADCRILHNGVDVSVFKPGLTRHENRFVIGTVSNFQRTKGYDTTILALARIKEQIGDWEWRIVGSGVEERRIRGKIKDVGIEDHVRFFDEVKHADLASFYQALDLYVMPSYWEGFGCVYTEAYACGVPFIACRNDNGIVDLAPDEWLVAKGDDGNLADLILAASRGDMPMRPLKGEYRIRRLVERFVDTLEVL